jgi:hypothetical protein
MALEEIPLPMDQLIHAKALCTNAGQFQDTMYKAGKVSRNAIFLAQG